MEFLGRVANRIVNEVRGINRVVYDTTSTPRHDRVGVTTRNSTILWPGSSSVFGWTGGSVDLTQG